MVLAVDAAGVALIAVGGTALGALVGAAAGGLVDYLLEERRDQREAKVGARLTRLDLALAASQLKFAEDDGKWWVFYDTDMSGWAERRAFLAAKLSKEDFETVTQSVAELERFGKKIQQAPIPPGLAYRGVVNSKASLNTMRVNATKAYNALAPLAEADEETGTLHDDQK
jgi:hypothetical protein